MSGAAVAPDVPAEVGEETVGWSRHTGHMTEALRLVVALVVVGLLARTVRPAWRHRGLALRVWSRIRLRHVLGSAVLLVVVVGVALTLLSSVPVTRFGLGELVGVTGNALFAPVEEVAARGGESGEALGLAVTGVFLAGLLALFPWLAYVEERAFREGLELAGPGRELWTALRFGLAHMVMLVPLAAALAIAVAGLVYGRVYRHAYRRAAMTMGPVTARAEAVLSATTWHATFNTLVVLGVLIGLVFDL